MKSRDKGEGLSEGDLHVIISDHGKTVLGFALSKETAKVCRTYSYERSPAGHWGEATNRGFNAGYVLPMRELAEQLDNLDIPTQQDRLPPGMIGVLHNSNGGLSLIITEESRCYSYGPSSRVMPSGPRLRSESNDDYLPTKLVPVEWLAKVLREVGDNEHLPF